MNKLFRTLFCVVLFVAGLWTESSATTRMLYLGDSTYITGYLPEEKRIHQQVVELFPGMQLEAYNQARGGQCIPRLFGQGHYETIRGEVPGVDLIFVRYGQNDQKRSNREQFAENLKFLCRQLQEDYPDAVVILDTGLYFYPGIMSFDRNERLDPYWQATREVAEELGLPLIDTRAAMEEATEAGNWDLRIRTREVWDDSQDEANRDRPNWFNNGHPNPEGVRVAAEAHAAVLREIFGDEFPTGGGKSSRPARSDAEWLEEMGLDEQVLLDRRDR